MKRFYFEHFRPGIPKIEQTLIARFVLDPAMSKDGQIEAFLNFTYFGQHAGRPLIGFEDAARAYFGHGLGRLSDRQYLSLVAMLMAPNSLDPVNHKAANEARVRRIEAMLSGKCAPAGLRDVSYQGCASAT